MTLLAVAALAAGFEATTELASSFGPDRYGLVEVRALADPGLAFGVVVVGGVRPAVLASAGRTIRLAEGWELEGEVLVGAVREAGAAYGGRLATTVEAGPVAVVLGGEWVRFLGVRVAGGVDAPLSERWTLMPRLRLETWAGDRDPALRVELGLARRIGVWTVAVAASVGGRDVLHTGGGLVLTVRRDP